eukprot:TRINITY_DN2228_c0_g1_i1.p1 TRINITY_DN2228_c0_g1~~TRINITY_DN2228_c0_g1_i1.p1  ORF type:complete len:424 (-),score=93.06 TRINITY_DN2228_c0_g1_i1:50-1174(-)
MVPPIIQTPRGFLLHIFRDNIFFLATTLVDTPPLLILEFLHRVADVFKDYFTVLSEESLKENFAIVYQLLDEMMDNGFPFTTEPNILRDMIKPPNFVNKASAVVGKSQVAEALPEGASSAIPWRRAGVKYATNEIFFDVVEEIDTIIDSNGMVISCDVTGEVQANCRLSGMPDLLLHFNNPRLLDDCSFHPCVRLKRYEQDRSLSFVPPDGPFKLMSFRINTPSNTSFNLPLYVKPQISFSDTAGHVQIMVGTKSLGKATVENLVLTIPFPRNVATTTLQSTFGLIHFDETTKVCKWEIGKLPKDKSPSLSGNLTLVPGSGPPDSQPIVSVDFRVALFSASGVKIESLSVLNEKYKPFKGVRSITKSGKFQIRT